MEQGGTTGVEFRSRSCFLAVDVVAATWVVFIVKSGRGPMSYCMLQFCGGPVLDLKGDRQNSM
jgi:hypothetical protein